MNFGLIGQMTPQEMRRVRVKEIIDKTKKDQETGLIKEPLKMQVSKDQEDNGRFLSKYFDTVNNKQYQQYFSQYNQQMFAKLIFFMKVVELDKHQFLYKKGDLSTHFYFILKGKLELVVQSQSTQDTDEFKFSKNVDDSEFFGLRTSTTEQRLDFARASVDKTWVLLIDKENYEAIIKTTQLSTSQKKIDFLIRYVPYLRKVSRNIVEEFEVFFIKEEITQGFPILKEGEQDDYLYFIFKGRCRMLLSTAGLPKVFPPELMDKNRKQLVIGQLKRGDCFGEHSALNDLPNPFTVEAVSKTVEIYKILRGNFIQYFGGANGEPVTQLRAQILIKQNWLKMKMDFLQAFDMQQIVQLEYRNEEEHAKLKPSKKVVKEVPFMANNPRAKEVHGADAGQAQNGPTGQAADPVKTARQREIEALKNSLLAPLNNPRGAAAPVGMNPINRDAKPAEGDKFSKVMDWGTPRLVTKNRQIVMDQKSMQQRNFLQNLAAERKGIAQTGAEEKKTGEFKAVSINNFREKMLQEEKMEQSNGAGPATTNLNAGLGTLGLAAHLQSQVSSNAASGEPVSRGPIGQINIGGGGGGILNKLRNTNEEDIKAKLKANIRGLPI